MVRTDDDIDMTTVFEQPMAAMAADVVEGLEPIVPVANDDDALVADLAVDEITGVAKLRAVANEIPTPIKNAFMLARQDFRVGVIVCGKRIGVLA